MADLPTPPHMPGFSSPMPPARQTGLAVATLVLGIIGLVACLPAGIIAIVTGIIALVRIGNQPHRYGGKEMAIAGLVCGCVSLITFPMCLSILLPSLSRARELSKRLVCASNMKAIGTAMHLYADDFGEEGEIEIDWLVEQGYLTHEPICPSSDLEVSNYILVRHPADEQMDNRTVILYEPKSNHGEEGGNFLFADGHVMFHGAEEYDELVAGITSPNQ
jgi:prepilin-type processing-associated H-X9-DG protein